MLVRLAGVKCTRLRFESLGQIISPSGSSSANIPNAASGAAISLDGRTLYLVDQGTGAVGAYDTTSLSQTGWIPSFTVQDSQAGIVISAIDETGLIVGPIGHGLGFLDASEIKLAEPTIIGTGFAAPNTGPATGGTVVSGGFAVADVKDSAALSNIYVGNVAGSAATFAASPGHINSGQVTTPSSNEMGAVDLTVVLSDGAIGVAPEAFSYGPTILEVVPNGATAEGGQLGAIIGYGFGNSTSGVQVSLGGRPLPLALCSRVRLSSPTPFRHKRCNS